MPLKVELIAANSIGNLFREDDVYKVSKARVAVALETGLAPIFKLCLKRDDCAVNRASQDIRYATVVAPFLN
jgi:hypothetical protein